MYIHFYGFSEEPFRDTPDPRFLFLVPGHQRALNCLLKGIEEKDGWVLLLGESGSGKTTLIRHLLQSLLEKPGKKTVFIFHPGISFEDLLKEILSELGLSAIPPAGTPLREHFSRSLSPLFASGETLVIFLDEAQDIGVKVLENMQIFFGKEAPSFERIRLVLSGQPSLEENLRSQSLRSLQQQIKHRCSIAPLTAQESRRYFDHRLHLAGGKFDLFTSDALDLVIRHGEGSPRTLNIICDNALRIGHRLSEPRIGAAIVRRALNEMYVQPKRRFFFREIIGGKSILPKIRYFLYFLLAIFIIASLYLLVAKNTPRQQETETAKPDPPSAASGRIPLPPAPGTEETLSPKKEDVPALQVEKAPPSPEIQAAPAILIPSAQAKRSGGVKKTVSVNMGATLHSLCWEHYGFANLTLMDHIMSLNPEITNPNLIRVNQVIKLPDLQEEDLIQERPGGKIIIFLGTFSHQDFSANFREEPLLKGREIQIASRRIETGETWQRFTVGPFAGREEALQAVRALKEKGLLPSFGGSLPKGGKSA